jgi:hypothetical protein
LVQVVFVLNVPNGYEGAEFPSPQCYGGYFFNSDSQSCEQCQVGSYKSNTTIPGKRATSCTSCPEGRYGKSDLAVTSSTHCVKCPSGKFGEAELAIGCSDCPEGRYGQFPGETSADCTDECPAGLICSTGTASPRRSSAFTWPMSRPRTRSRALQGSSSPR